MRFNKTEREEQ